MRPVAQLLTLAIAAAPLASQGVHLPPADLAPGQPYRILCQTAGRTDATSTDIDTYNTFVRNDVAAAPELAAFGVDWRVVGSTATVDAKANTNTDPSPAGSTGVPIYRPDGVRIADDYDELWSGTLQAPPLLDAMGSPSGNVVLTGTTRNGSRRLPNTLGDAVVALGDPDFASTLWIQGGGFPATTETRLYAISDLVAAPLAPPADLQPGDSYRILVVTDSTTNAASSDIADYDAFVTQDVRLVDDLAGLRVEWRALASTSAVSARANTGTDASAPGIQGVPIYLRDGTRVANDYDDLWDGSLLASPRLTASGIVTPTNAVWTGTTRSGTPALGAALGRPAPQTGRPRDANLFWMESARLSSSSQFRLYAMSAVLTVPIEATEIARVGSLPNPNVFLPGVTSRPIAGATWDPVIDHTTFVPDALFDFMLITSDPLDVPIASIATGHVLCDIFPWHIPVTNATPGTPFSFAMPDGPELIGQSLCVQGGSANAGPLPIHFANALDIVVGTF